MFPRSGLFWKFVIPYVVLAATAGASLCWISGKLLEETLVSARQRNLVTDQLVLGRTFVDTFAVDQPGQLLRFVGNYSAILGRRVTFVRGDGTVVADSREAASRMPNLRNDPAIAVARREMLGSAIVPLDFDLPDDRATPRALSVARRIGPADDPAGIVRFVASLEDIDEQVRNFRGDVASWVTVVGTLGLLVVGYVSQRVSSPIGLLTRAATGADRRATFRKVASGGGDELSRLGQALRRLDEGREALIADLRDQNRDLRTREDLAAAVLDGITEGVLAIDADEKILSINQAAVRLLDLPAGRLVGRPLWEVVRQPAIVDAVRRAAADRATPTEEFRTDRGDLTLAVRAGLLPGDPGPGVAVVVHDVTELRRLETIRSEFVANVHHELKTPLSVISACTETLLNGAGEDPDHRSRFLSRIATQSDRLAGLIGDLLKIARVESARDVFEFDTVDLGGAATACVDDHLEVAGARDVFLAAVAPAETVRVVADEQGLRTILDNLVANAVRYTPTGGTVRVAWRAVDDKAAEVEVTDTGIGIPPEHRDRVFERFHRVDAARSRDDGGTGLGLAIVKHFVNVLGGSISLRSTPGEGSTFVVRLPRS